MTTMTPAALTPEQISIVKSTAPILRERGTEITTYFYKHMLEEHPELRNIFNHTSQSTGSQPRALASAVFAYAENVDNLKALTGTVERIAQKHASLDIQPDQYPIVGKYLIEAVATVLGPKIVTSEVGEAWTRAYELLASVFIGREQQLYKDHVHWLGWRKFEVLRKVKESSDITSFYLKPQDGNPLPDFLPGQYISVRVTVPELGVLQPRQYSLSEAPKGNHETYRISVKREVAADVSAKGGVVSNLLHDDYEEGDVLELTHPHGEFYIDPSVKTLAPAVLLSAGVGVTPMMAIAETAAPSGRPISWIQGARTSKTMAFNDDIKRLQQDFPNINIVRFLSEVGETDVKGEHYDTQGRISLNQAKDSLYLDNSEAEYYVCGPIPFMHSIRDYLIAQNVEDNKINMELFGVGNARE